MIVYLVGMPGSGKSTVGREVAGRLGVPFVDLDEEIERRSGSSVSAIFASEGEAAFRAMEARELVGASRHDPSVVACGGGVVLEPANRIALRNTGTCVYLDVPIEVLQARVESAAHLRVDCVERAGPVVGDGRDVTVELVADGVIHRSSSGRQLRWHRA